GLFLIARAAGLGWRIRIVPRRAPELRPPRAPGRINRPSTGGLLRVASSPLLLSRTRTGRTDGLPFAPLPARHAAHGKHETAGLESVGDARYNRSSAPCHRARSGTTWTGCRPAGDDRHAHPRAARPRARSSSRAGNVRGFPALPGHSLP